MSSKLESAALDVLERVCAQPRHRWKLMVDGQVPLVAGSFDWVLAGTYGQCRRDEHGWVIPPPEGALVFAWKSAPPVPRNGKAP